MKSYARQDRVASVLQKVLAETMQREGMPFWLTITHVKLSPDMKHAEVFYSVLDESHLSEAPQILETNKHHLKYAVNKNMRLKFLPELKFSYDESLVYQQHIVTLIDGAPPKEI
jgi:ribosome-binding factor A